MYMKSDEHRGGQLGLLALICMLAMTSCATFAQQGQSGGMSWLPGWGQVAQQTLPAQTTTVEQPAATFIVRFKNEPRLDEICKNFRRDRAGSRAKFTSWSASHPELNGLVLASASYSGEIVLALPQNDPHNRTPQQVLSAIKGMDNLAYADVDAIAHPGAGR